MYIFQHFFVLIVLASLGPILCLAAVTNRTIDDTNGDSVTGEKVVYQPDLAFGQWNRPPCSFCSIQPDLSQAFDQTWTAATYFLQTQDTISATMTFNGTAIYVYFILANKPGTNPFSTTETAANFTLDGQDPTLFEHFPDPSTEDLIYNQLVYQQTNLENTQHLLVISVSGLQREVWVNFDYAIYTHEELDAASNSPPTLVAGTGKKSHRAGIIGGAVAGGVVFLALIARGIVVMKRRQRRAKASKLAEPVEFQLHSRNGKDV